MRRGLLVLLACLCLLSLAFCARAEPDPRPWRQILAEDGLAAAEAKLAGSPGDAETAFALGGVRFLRAIETIMQTRYANYSGALPLLPGMRNELPVNPEGRFDPAFLENAMAGALTHLAGAEASLQDAIGEDFTMDLQLGDLWFDINANGAREDWEGVLALMATLGAEPDEAFDGVIRFDTADADWLKAYVHVVSGMAEITLAVDPTPAITAVYEGRSQLEAMGPLTGLGFIGDDTVPDTVAAILLTLRGVPDATRTRAAHAHFKAMIAHNRAFWSLVGEETDNDHEWLPNADQTSAFGVEVDAGTAERWQGVLTEIDAILDGELLVPYWRFGFPEAGSEGVGVNIARLMQSPGDMDLLLWVQGAGAAPYLETGEIASMAAWQQFAMMTRGDSLMLAVWFN